MPPDQKAQSRNPSLSSTRKSLSQLNNGRSDGVIDDKRRNEILDGLDRILKQKKEEKLADQQNQSTGFVMRGSACALFSRRKISTSKGSTPKDSPSEGLTPNTSTPKNSTQQLPKCC